MFLRFEGQKVMLRNELMDPFVIVVVVLNDGDDGVVSVQQTTQNP